MESVQGTFDYRTEVLWVEPIEKVFESPAVDEAADHAPQDVKQLHHLSLSLRHLL